MTSLTNPEKCFTDDTWAFLSPNGNDANPGTACAFSAPAPLGFRQWPAPALVLTAPYAPLSAETSARTRHATAGAVGPPR